MNQQKAHAPETDRTRYAIVAILLLSAVARFAFIGRQSLWFEELYNVWANRLSFSDMLSEQLAAAHPPLYYVVVRAWYLLGTGEVWVRSFSALAGVATVYFTYMAGRELFSRRAGLWAAVFTALSPLLIMYSRANSYYSFMIALTTLSLWLLVRASLRGGWRNWAAYTVAAAAVLMSYFFGAVMVGAGWVVFLIIRRGENKNLWPWLTSQAALILAIAGTFLLSRQVSSDPSMLVFPGKARVLAYFYMLVVSPFVLVAGRIDSSILFSGTESIPTLHIVVLGFVTIALVMCLGFSRTLRKLLLTRATVSLALFVFLMVSGPLALQLVNSGRLSSRFYVWAVPALMLLIGAVVAAIPRRLGALLGGMLVVALLTFTVIEVQYKESGDADWRALMATVAERQAEGDLLVSFSMHNGQIAASYYLPQQLPIVGGMLAGDSDAIFFMEPGETWSGYRSGYWAGSGVEPALTGVEQEDRFAADLTGAKRLWFVAESDMLEKYPIVKKVLDEGWVEKEHWDYPPFILNLYELRLDMGNQVSQ